jgi:hypothetical protein
MPSAVCPWCGNEVAVKKDGTFKLHDTRGMACHRGAAGLCEGSEHDPGPERDQREIAAAREELRALGRDPAKARTGPCGRVLVEENGFLLHEDDATHCFCPTSEEAALAATYPEDPEPVHEIAPRARSQLDLEGVPVERNGANVEVKLGARLLFEHDHFRFAIGADRLKRLRAQPDGPARVEKAALKLLKPLPDVDEIPRGAKAREGKALVQRALALPVDDAVRTAMSTLLGRAP